MKQLRVQYRESLPDLLQVTPEQFESEARMAMVAKLFELGRISSGFAAEMVGMNRVQFLMELSNYQVSAMNFPPEELAADAGVTGPNSH